MNEKTKMDIQEVKRILNEAEEANSSIRDRIKTDISFASSIGSHWTDDDRKVRGESRGEFSFPLFPAYIQKIVGIYNSNPFSIKLEAVNPENEPGADALQEKICEIEDKCNAKEIYQTALKNAISCGYGMIYVTTNVDKKGEEVVELQAIHNPLSIFFDPASEEVDGSDAEYCVHKEEISKEKAKRLYENFDEDPTDPVLWNPRIDATVPVITIWKMNEKGTVDIIKAVGNQVVDETTLEINRLPVIPVHGETALKTSDGGVEYTGIVHRAIDTQRLLNYANSLSAERLALSPKANYIVEASSIKEHQKIWEQANRMNFPALPYDGWDKNNRALPPPQKQDTAINIGDITNLNNLYSYSIANVVGIPLEGMVNGDHTIKTAEEIMTRQKNSETVLSVYFEHLSSSIKAVGDVMLQLIPQVYTDVNGIKDLKISVSAGPMIATLRKEKLRNYLAMASLLPAYMPVIAPRMIECMDGVEEELVEQCKAISVMELQRMEAQLQQTQQQTAQAQGAPAEIQQSPEMQNLINQNIALQNQVAELSAKLEQVNEQWNEKKADLEADIVIEQLRHKNAMELEALRQQGQTSREDKKLVAEAEKTAFEARARLDQTIAKADAETALPPEVL